MNNLIKLTSIVMILQTFSFATTLTSLNLEANTTTLNVGENTQFTLMAAYSDGSTKEVATDIEWITTPVRNADVNGRVLSLKKDGNVTVQAKVGTTLSNTLNLTITWVVNGHVLPPEPDKTLNDSTLLGIDTNDNGVRDDVERYIYENYEQPIERGIFMQSSRAYGMLIVDPSRALETKQYSDNVLICEFYWIYKHQPIPFDEYEYYNNRKKLKKIQFNTLNRHINYDKYQKTLSGGVYNLLPKSKEKCEFDENGILGDLK